MRAILLAAGEGSRLRPFTLDKPKPMVRVANKPVLQHAIEALTANGIQDVTIVVGYHREKIQSYFGEGKRFGARITYAFQEALGGTAHALATAPPPSGSFLLLGGDNLVDAALVRSALAVGDGPALVAHRSTRPQRYGVLTLDGSRLVRIEEKPERPRSEWVNTGVYRLPAEFHARAKAIAATPHAGLPDLLQQAIGEGRRVEVVLSDDLWADAVYPWDLLGMHAQLLQRQKVAEGTLLGPESSLGAGVVLTPSTCIGSNVSIGPHSVLENCIVYDDAEIGPGAILRNTIVGAGTRIGARFTSISGPCDIRSVDGWHHLEDFGAVIGEDARIGGGVTLLPGTVLGNGVHAAHGRTLSGSVPDRSHVL